MDCALVLLLIRCILFVKVLFNFTFRSTILFKSTPNEIKQLRYTHRKKVFTMRETGFISSFESYVSNTC